MWQASLSHRDRRSNKTRPTDSLTPAELRDAERVLLDWLEGVGDRALERVARMTGSIAVYRATTEAEREQMPVAFFMVPPVHTFGGAVEILRETEPAVLSARPCLNPGRRWVDRRANLWLPTDCGECPPCLARKALDQELHDAT